MPEWFQMWPEKAFKFRDFLSQILFKLLSILLRNPTEKNINLILWCNVELRKKRFHTKSRRNNDEQFGNGTCALLWGGFAMSYPGISHRGQTSAKELDCCPQCKVRVQGVAFSIEKEKEWRHDFMLSSHTMAYQSNLLHFDLMFGYQFWTF